MILYLLATRTTIYFFTHQEDHSCSRSLLVEVVSRLREAEEGLVEEEQWGQDDDGHDQAEGLAPAQVPPNEVRQTPVETLRPRHRLRLLQQRWFFSTSRNAFVWPLQFVLPQSLGRCHNESKINIGRRVCRAQVFFASCYILFFRLIIVDVNFVMIFNCDCHGTFLTPVTQPRSICGNHHRIFFSMM